MHYYIFLYIEDTYCGEVAQSVLRGSSQNFGIFFIIGPILLKFAHNM